MSNVTNVSLTFFLMASEALCFSQGHNAVFERHTQ